MTKNLSRSLLLILLGWLSALPGALRAETPIPPSLAVPDGQKLALTLTARGVQIYECRPTQGDPAKFEWVFKAPEADLFDAAGRKVGRHYAGPTWELTDNGTVVGRVKAKADAPDGKGVPWLLLEAASSTGAGVLTRVRSIQRVNTAGGMPPKEAAESAQAGQERRVEYSAVYLFYVGK